jgi:hypothetical protein
LLDTVSEVESLREEQEARIRAALEVLDEVVRLRHAQNDEFTPLLECQHRAQVMRQAILEGELDGRSEVVASLADRDHPFAYLATMVSGADVVNDELWDSLFNAVAAEFGRPLAAAAARGRVVAFDPARDAAPAPATVVPAIETRVPEPKGVEPSPTAEVAPAPATTAPEWSQPSVTGLGLDGLEVATFDAYVSRGPSIAIDWAAPTGAVGDWREHGPSASELAAGLADEDLSTVLDQAWTGRPRGWAALRPARRLARFVRRSSPEVENLEALSLLSACPSISGYVYLDANKNGLFDTSEKPLAGNSIELLNAQNVVVGKAITDASGAYQFLTDNTISTAPKTQTFSGSLSGQFPNVDAAIQLPQFDPSLGTLTGVDLTFVGTVHSDIRSQNLSSSDGTTIVATLSGQVAITMPTAGVTAAVPVPVKTGTFDAVAFSSGEAQDFSTPSGHDFGPWTTTGTHTKSLSTQAGDDLSAFVGTGKVPTTVKFSALVQASGGGNLATDANSTADSSVTVTYHYTPSNCLAPGSYTIVQTDEPPNTVNGLQSRDGVALPPNHTGGPDTIPVTLGTTNLVNNDFGEFNPNPSPQTRGGPPPSNGDPPPCTMPLPTIDKVQRFGVHHHRTQMVLTFNEAIDPATATDLANYQLHVAYRDGRIGQQLVPLQSAVYNPTNHTVTLTPLHDLNIHYHYLLTVSGIKDTCGQTLDGAHNGVAGSNFVTILTKQDYAGPAPTGPAAVAAKVAAWSNRFPRLAAATLGTLARGH